MIYLLNNTYCLVPRNYNANPSAYYSKGYTLLLNPDKCLQVLPADYKTSDLKQRVVSTVLGRFKTETNVGRLFLSRFTHKLGMVVEENGHQSTIFVLESQFTTEIGQCQRIVNTAIEFAPEGFIYVYDSKTE